MTVDKASLKSDLEDIAKDPPGTVALCAKAWADAVGAYVTDLTPPPTPVSITGATAALETSLLAAFGTTAAAAPMEAAFTALGAALGTGMAPAFIATPPAVPVGFATLFTPPFPTTHSDAAAAMADAIHAWLTTGTAVPAAGGAAVYWA
jgi:hypothetical protein